jgi:hypothetical protein
MIRYLFQFLIIFVAALASAVQIPAQTTACKIPALAALKPIPEFQYECGDEESESNAAFEAKRRRALNLYAETLEKLTAADWWQTAVEDLTVCDFRKKAGALSEEEKTQYEGGEYFFNLRGNGRFRAIVVREPCRQSSFNELNVFLLNRVGRKVYASLILDGFVTRADFPLGFNSGLFGTEPVIEIATTSGGLNPRDTNYYFTIDKKTLRAVPKKMFRDEDGKLTNRISSMTLMGDAEEYGLPRGSIALQVIKNGRLARTFDVFQSTGEAFGNDGNERFKRRTLRWNGRVYK